MTKYHAKPTTIEGIRFASKKEANRYKELHILREAGVITKLECHPKFVIGAYDKEGVYHLLCTYIADFQYYDREKKEVVIEDVKGY